MLANRSPRWLIPLALASALAGCVVRQPEPAMEDAADLFTLSVVNHHRLNVTIYNVAQGHRDRIGEVTAAAKAEFPLHLDRYVGHEIQLYADAVGSPETVRSELIHVSPGDVVEWTLETELNRSTLVIR